MDDTQFMLAYGIFAAAVIGGLLFLLSMRLDRKRYLRPVVYGVIFGGLCSILLLGGFIAFLLGGAITGYFLAREIGGGWNHFRAGAIEALMFESSLTLANISLFAIRSVSWYLTDLTQKLGRPVGHEELLYSLFGVTLLDIFFIVAIVGMGAVLGGILRKVLKPAAQKP